MATTVEITEMRKAYRFAADTAARIDDLAQTKLLQNHSQKIARLKAEDDKERQQLLSVRQSVADQLVVLFGQELKCLTSDGNRILRHFAERRDKAKEQAEKVWNDNRLGLLTSQEKQSSDRMQLDCDLLAAEAGMLAYLEATQNARAQYAFSVAIANALWERNSTEEGKPQSLALILQEEFSKLVESHAASVAVRQRHLDAAYDLDWRMLVEVDRDACRSRQSIIQKYEQSGDARLAKTELNELTAQLLRRQTVN